MLLPQRTTITIETGENYFTAIFKRQYILTVHANEAGRAIISLKFQDYCPSGYMDGDNRGTLLESQEVKIPSARNMTAKKWLAKLAHQHDKKLFVVTGCERLNKSRLVIIRSLASQF
jgi:hypothetical protein